MEKNLPSEFFALFFSLSSHVDQLFPLSSLSVSFHVLSVVRTSKRDKKQSTLFSYQRKCFIPGAITLYFLVTDVGGGRHRKKRWNKIIDFPWDNSLTRKKEEIGMTCEDER